ncbi:MAG: multidrug DMT transporter permease [Bacteroidetes bacterium]|nr:multidrug DMT transporter permease [Bacteroidota bacterium]
MFIIQSYSTAVIFCIITMLCWGSWANTQKLAGNNWRFELFYWDYVIGIVLFSLLCGFTLGSIGQGGRSFMADLQQADYRNLFSAFIGGIVFNAANILVVAAIAIAGMSVAFPVGIGIALILGVIINYVSAQHGNPILLFTGVSLVAAAIVLNARAYRIKAGTQTSVPSRGLLLAIIGGVLMSLFYRFIAASMDLNDFVAPEPGKMTPYSAVFVFSLGVLFSNFFLNSWLIFKPFVGKPTSYHAYFSGRSAHHFYGILGGLIWGIGNSFNLIAAGKAGPAISYGLGQGATLVAAFWGVFIWKEFDNAPMGVNKLIIAMFGCFLLGLILIVLAG